MAPIHPLPLRLLSRVDGNFKVVDMREYAALKVDHFDILTHVWGQTCEPYNCEIDGVGWNVILSPRKINNIKRLMVKANIAYLWVDSLCLNQEDDAEKNVEVLKMYEYYKSARKCYALMEMHDVWDPQDIVNDLKSIDHILSYMTGTALAKEAGLGRNLINYLDMWSNTNWVFPMEREAAMSAAVDLSVLNCYATCISRVKSLFENDYFTRVWTFQEMLLGKNITIYGMNEDDIACVGELATWMNLATDCVDKAIKLRNWVDRSRPLKNELVNTILRIIEEDCLDLVSLQTQAEGINSARSDIINGGPFWWRENYKGVANVFSAISITPRKCGRKHDIFRGLLGIFNGLFTPEEVAAHLDGDDVEKMSFEFFKQLSVKTGYAWTRLAVSREKREQYDWIPVVKYQSNITTTDCYAAVFNMGVLDPKKGSAKADAMTGIIGEPRKYMKIELCQRDPSDETFRFKFRGCNCGKKVKTGTFSSERIICKDQPTTIVGDETGRALVQCATILGSIIDPGSDVVEYRKRLLTKLQPSWKVTDPLAKPIGWEDKCVSGTDWEEPIDFRVHNRSLNYIMESVSCGSRLENESTSKILCKLEVNCGCKITGSFPLIFQALTAVEESSLGETSVKLDNDGRIIWQDGLGLVQVGDVGKIFNVVAYSGDVDAYRSYASRCRSTNLRKEVISKPLWPKSRAMVGEEFTHGMAHFMRNYGYVNTGGSGNLLICRNQPLDKYKVIGVCIDQEMEVKKGSEEEKYVTIQ